MPTPIQIRTTDGVADAHVIAPDGGRPAPGILLYADAFGIRPALLAMARNLANHGYWVLLPNLFWRMGSFPPFDPKTVWQTPKEAERLRTLIQATDEESLLRDTKAYLAFASHEGRVRGRKIGVLGYCLGGGLALRAACEFPDSIAAVASFHGGRFQVDPGAPAILASKLRASVYLGVAEKDARHDATVTRNLLAGLENARVPHSVEVYPGTEHGFAMPDSAVFDAKAHETHWARIFSLFGSAL
ncbi:MAG: dienelactone hydrolase family protein [Polyangiaceae bacterium]